MLRRTNYAGNLVLYHSPLLERAGVPHAFTTRLGGVSNGAFASLNLGNPADGPQDAADNLRTNHDRVQRAIDCETHSRRWLRQVHGNAIQIVGNDFTDGADGDGLISVGGNDLLTIRVADCVPVLLASADGGAVGAVHAGWRGVVAGVVPAAAAALAQIAAINPRELIAAIGPCIGFDAFEVGPEVWSTFESAFGPAVIRRDRADAKGRVDLRGAILRQLHDSGLPTRAIDTTDRCTFTHADDFFSHRRDNGLTGRMAAMIAPRRDTIPAT